MSIFTKNFASIFTASGFLVLLAYSFPTQAGVEPKQAKFQYKLIMSKDDAVCKPLTEQYNEMLVSYMKVWRTKKLNTDEADAFDAHEIAAWTPGWATDFEVWESKKFEKIGFIKPLQISAGEHQARHYKINEPHEDDASGFGDYVPGLYQVDLFGEGLPRVVNIYDGSHASNRQNFETEITVFKKGIGADKISGGDQRDTDPAIIDRDASFRGLVNSQKEMKLEYLGYVLKKWPDFDKLYNQFLEEKKRIGMPNSFPPSMGGGSARIFMHSGRPYFVLNEYAFMKPVATPAVSQGSTVVVYQLTPSSQEDICYISIGK